MRSPNTSAAVALLVFGGILTVVSSSSLDSAYPGCDSVHAFAIGDGYCDATNNNDVCGFDGGDCCPCTCVPGPGACTYFEPGCKDPTASCSENEPAPIGEGACVPTGDIDGSCNESGCCDLFMACNADGTCSLPTPECTDESSCGEGDICAGGRCQPFDPTATITDSLNDPDSPYVAVLGCSHASDIYVIGDRDDSGVIWKTREVVSSTEEAGVVHVLFGDDGKPSVAYSESMDEEARFVYDGAGNMVSAEPVRRRRRLGVTTTDRLGSSRALRAPVDFASLERAYLDASNAKAETVTYGKTCYDRCEDDGQFLDFAMAGNCAVMGASIGFTVAGPFGTLLGSSAGLFCAGASIVTSSRLKDECKESCEVEPESVPAPTPEPEPVPAPTPKPVPAPTPRPVLVVEVPGDDDEDNGAEICGNPMSLLERIGNGWCDPSNNTPGCGYDGGDCCSCTCSNGYYACGTNGYTCVDPNANCVYHQGPFL